MHGLRQSTRISRVLASTCNAHTSESRICLVSSQSTILQMQGNCKQPLNMRSNRAMSHHEPLTRPMKQEALAAEAPFQLLLGRAMTSEIRPSQLTLGLEIPADCACLTVSHCLSRVHAVQPGTSSHSHPSPQSSVLRACGFLLDQADYSSS